MGLAWLLLGLYGLFQPLTAIVVAIRVRRRQRLG
jgi:hypothetical protein